MKKVLFVIFLTLASFSASAQEIYARRSSTVTLFPEYQRATVTLSNGKVNRLLQCNVFLKKSTFLYMQGGKPMEANMQAIKHVKFGDRTFINMHSQLAEVVDSCGENLLLRVETIDVENMKREYYNNSSITNFDLSSDLLGVTRLDQGEDSFQFPLDVRYYYRIGDKYMVCMERETRAGVGKKGRDVFNRVTHGFNFDWNNIDDLKSLLHELSEVMR